MTHPARSLWHYARLALAVPFSALTVTAVTLPPAQAAADDDFFDCTTALLDAGISQVSATAVCAAARYPSQVSNCAIDVTEVTGLAVADALNVCERSRRPDEVANCTLNIYDSLSEVDGAVPTLSAHTFCGRSLLPERYGTCVVDLTEATDLSVDDSLTRCIRAGYRPWEMGPRL